MNPSLAPSPFPPGWLQKMLEDTPLVGAVVIRPHRTAAELANFYRKAADYLREHGILYGRFTETSVKIVGSSSPAVYGGRACMVGALGCVGLVDLKYADHCNWREELGPLAAEIMRRHPDHFDLASASWHNPYAVVVECNDRLTPTTEEAADLLERAAKELENSVTA